MHINKIILIAFLFIITVPCYSFANYNISPIGFFLKRDFKVTSLELTNNTSENRYVQATILKWDRKNNKDVFTETSDFLVTPAIFEIKPNKRQVIRIAREIDNFGSDEASYKINIQEIPSKNKSNGKVNILLNFLLPFFIEPENKIPFYEGVKTKKRSDSVVVTNNLNYHLKVVGILQGSDKKIESAMHYIFPNETAILKFPGIERQQVALLFDDCGEERKIDVD